MNLAIPLMHLFAYSPATVLGMGHRAGRQTVMTTLPLPSILSVGQHTLYKHPEYGDRESVGSLRTASPDCSTGYGHGCDF